MAIKVQSSVESGGLIANGSAFRFDSTRLATLKAAVANRNNAAVRILALGDSRTEGEANTVANRWVNKLAGLLRTAYPVSGAAGGLGYIPGLFVSATTLTNPHSYTGTKSALSGGLGGGTAVSTGRGYQLSAGATVTRVFTGTGIDIVYTKGTTAGSFSYTIDGGSSTTVNANQAATSSGNVEAVRGLTSASHTLVITAVGTTFFEGTTAYDGDESKGFNVFEGGHSGATTGDAIQTSSSAYDPYRMVAPHLVILDFTTNDWLVGGAPTSRISPRQTEANLRDLIAAARSADTDPSIILVEPVKRGVINTTVAVKGPWSEYTQAIRRVAKADGRVTLFDQQAALGDFSTGSNANAYTDQVHFSVAGNTANAQAIADLIAAA
jgi:lysophospholipase L1-like esterase